MRAEPAGKQAVAIGIVDNVARPRPAGAKRSRNQVGPIVDVLRGVADNRWLAGGARRGMDAHHLGLRHGKQAKRIVVAQVGLVGERQLGDIGKLFDISRMNATRRKAVLIHRDVVIGMPGGPLQAFNLQRANFVDRGDFYRIEIGFSGCQILQWLSSSNKFPPMAREWPRSSATTTPS